MTRFSKTLAILWGFILLWAKFVPNLANFYDVGLIFIVVKGSLLTPYLAIWSHWKEHLSKLMLPKKSCQSCPNYPFLLLHHWWCFMLVISTDILYIFWFKFLALSLHVLCCIAAFDWDQLKVISTMNNNSVSKVTLMAGQCDQIGRFLKALGHKISCKSTPNVKWLCGQF